MSLSVGEDSVDVVENVREHVFGATGVMVSFENDDLFVVSSV